MRYRYCEENLVERWENNKHIYEVGLKSRPRMKRILRKMMNYDLKKVERSNDCYFLFCKL